MRSQLTALLALLVGLAAGLAAPPGAKLDAPRVQRVPRPQLTAMTSGSTPNRAGLKVAAGAALGNILQGFNTGVIAGALVLIEPEFGLALRPAVTGLIASSTTFGAIAGTLGSSALADRAGRKRALAASCALFLLGGALMAWSPTAGVLVAGRFVGGTAAGLVSAAVPTYIAECAEPAWRGALSTLPQLCVSTGILLSYLVGLAALVGGAGWRLMLGASLVPPACRPPSSSRCPSRRAGSSRSEATPPPRAPRSSASAATMPSTPSSRRCAAASSARRRPRRRPPAAAAASARSTSARC